MSATLCFGQDAIISKMDSVQYVEDSTKLITYKGKKSGLYDIDQGYYQLKPAKQAILYYPNKEAYVVISSKEIWVFQHDIEGDLEEIDLDKTQNVFSDFRVIELGETRVIIESFDKAELLRDEHDFLTLYKGCHQSGIFDRTTNSWDIPPVYSRIVTRGTSVLCLKSENPRKIVVDDIGFEGFVEQDFNYDQYLISEQGVSLIGEGIDSLSKFDFGPIYYVYDTFTPDENNMIGAKDDLYGLYRINPFYITEQDEYPIYWDSLMLNHKFSFLNFNPEQTMAIGYIKGKSSPIEFNFFPDYEDEVRTYTSANELWAKVIIGDPVLVVTDDSTYSNYTPLHEEAVHDAKYGIKLLGDSLISLTDYEIGEMIMIYDPEYGEPMLDENDNILYNVDTSYFRSGIYDLKKGKWAVPPKYHLVYPAKNGWIATRTEVSRQDHQIEETILVLDKDLNTIHEFNDRANFFEYEELLNILIAEYPVDKVFEGPTDLDNIYRSDRLNKYFRSGDDLGIVYPDLKSKNVLYKLIEPEAFVHANRELGIVFKCDRQNLILEIDNSKYTVTKENAKIEIIYPVKGNEVSDYKINVIKGKDTSSYNGRTDLLTYSLRGDLTASIQFADNRLIVNENTEVSEYMMDSWGELYSDGYYNPANSAIWEFRDNQFDRATTFYSFIEPNPFGYMARTIGWSGDPIEVDGFFKWDNDSFSLIYENAKPNRYLLLGQDLKAVSFLDYYDFDLIEDLGYGLSLTTEKGKMFVDYAGNAITADEWDQFELEDGKLKAMKLNELIDEYGEPYYQENGKYYDWEGNEFDPIKEFKYFDLKK